MLLKPFRVQIIRYSTSFLDLAVGFYYNWEKVQFREDLNRDEKNFQWNRTTGKWNPLDTEKIDTIRTIPDDCPWQKGICIRVKKAIALFFKDHTIQEGIS